MLPGPVLRETQLGWMRTRESRVRACHGYEKKMVPRRYRTQRCDGCGTRDVRSGRSKENRADARTRCEAVDTAQAATGAIGALDVDVLHQSSRKKSRCRATLDSRTSESHSARTRASRISRSEIPHEGRWAQDGGEKNRQRRAKKDNREKDNRKKDHRKKENGAPANPRLGRADAR